MLYSTVFNDVDALRAGGDRRGRPTKKDGAYMAGFLSKLLTLGEGKQLKHYEATAQKINGLEPGMQAKSDEELRALTAALRERLRAASRSEPAARAFAAVREASVRTLGMRHFDVQLIGGMALNDGQIAEMKTGEGKTLVSTLAGYLNALPGKRARRHRQRLPGPARQRVDGPGLPLPRHGRGPHRTACAPTRRSPPTRRTSPTARTTSSASTTCATTW